MFQWIWLLIKTGWKSADLGRLLLWFQNAQAYHKLRVQYIQWIFHHGISMPILGTLSTSIPNSVLVYTCYLQSCLIVFAPVLDLLTFKHSLNKSCNLCIGNYFLCTNSFCVSRYWTISCQLWWDNLCNGKNQSTAFSI